LSLLLTSGLILGTASLGGGCSSDSAQNSEANGTLSKELPPDFKDRPEKVRKKMEKLKITKDS
jgi:hypothetical protein